ncbi:hypothetical protein PRIPAC_86240 [Pristionchus pacificus]|uniref:Uncharacterized protein n=1 Tax=Pristionchus pacificus TaxID=54126 RepID=A0A2A6BMM0_PRIPA|nr:hypothetical protein PRIPAC_86240 [Pristionchus pacificus]|eukprot:PDM67145.1 hypothetical protein PRIPAC_48562 [Pristionchus pacificus]
MIKLDRLANDQDNHQNVTHNVKPLVFKDFFIEYATVSEASDKFIQLLGLWTDAYERYNEETGRFEEVFCKVSASHGPLREWEQLSMWTEEEIREIPSFFIVV